MLRLNSTYYPYTRYGVEGKNEGPLYVSEITAPDAPTSAVALDYKELILLVDVSGSMRIDIASVKESLRIFLTVLLEASGATTSDQLFKERGFVIKLVTFSSGAKVVWDSSTATTTFEEVVNSLRVDGHTDIGAALKLAYQEKIPSRYTWIVLFTDGEPTTGVQSAAGFVEFLEAKPEQTKLVNIGYGTSISAPVLEALGGFSYIDHVEKISGIFGVLANEICLTYVFDVNVTPRFPEGSITLFGANKVGANKSAPNKNGFGVDVMYAEKTFVCGIVTTTFIPANLLLKYKCLSPHGIVDISLTGEFSVSHEAEAPFNIRKAYFDAAAGRRIAAISRTSVRDSDVVALEKELEGWTDLAAETALSNLRTFIKNRTTPHSRYVASSMSTDFSTQTSYVNPTAMTPMGRMYSVRASDRTYQAPGSTPLTHPQNGGASYSGTQY
jgi:uncharacterized protein YegL